METRSQSKVAAKRSKIESMSRDERAVQSEKSSAHAGRGARGGSHAKKQSETGNAGQEAVHDYARERDEYEGVRTGHAEDQTRRRSSHAYSEGQQQAVDPVAEQPYPKESRDDFASEGEKFTHETHPKDRNDAVRVRSDREKSGGEQGLSPSELEAGSARSAGVEHQGARAAKPGSNRQ